MQSDVSDILNVQDVLGIISDGNLHYFKYVKTENGYSFSNGTNYVTHKDIAQGRPVDSSAYIMIYPDGIYIEGYASTLRRGSSPGDEKELSRLLNLPIKP